jgi:hypothetical protein
MTTPSLLKAIDKACAIKNKLKTKGQELRAALLPRISTDFSSHFHIRKNHKTRTTPAWILHFTNMLHLFLMSSCG